MKRLKFFFAVLLLCFPLLMPAQNQEAKLAAQYYRNGEYEKAAQVFDDLYKKSKNNDYYFNKYIECLLALEKYQECEDAIKKQIKKSPKNAQLYVTYGNLFERQSLQEKAKKQFETAIEKVGSNRSLITRLANAFVALAKYNYAIQTYEKGSRMLKDGDIFAYNLGDLYHRKGDIPKMIENFLRSLRRNPGYLGNLKTQFQKKLIEEDYLELQTQLYAIIQETEDNVQFIELLSWVFIQTKDYKNALRQAKALDRRLNENGNRIFNLARTAKNAKYYEAAIEAFDYIISEKGQSSTFYIDAKKESLTCKRKKLVEGFDYSREELKVLENEYLVFIDEFGRNRATASIIIELAELEAFYLNDLDNAIQLLQEMTELPGLDPPVLAKGKLSLADFYLMQGERWESTLLYSQVDKDFQEDLLGHEARFRNAKLSYYMGDFEWAQAQFDVLKASTSKLIANDALDLSIFIMDNLGLDTTAESLTLYATADLLVFQNLFAEAFTQLDTLLRKFPEHSLEDDVFYLKAQIYMKKREYHKAAEIYQKIIDDYSDEIRADNSIFALATLFENQLDDVEQAKSLYEKLFIDFSGSTFAVEARKRFRKLRGDNIQ